MTPPLLCAGVEIALNRYLRLEPAVIEECARLQNRSIELVLTAPALSFVIEFIAGGVRVLPAMETQADVKVQGTAASIIGLLRRIVADDHSLPTELSIEGDAELLQRFRRMLTQVGFDPEEWLAPLLGGAVAHRLVSGLQRVFGWSRASGQRLAANTAEYLREETYDLARKSDVEDWAGDVDDLRETVDRLEARLALLEQASSPKIGKRTSRRNSG